MWDNLKYGSKLPTSGFGCGQKYLRGSYIFPNEEIDDNWKVNQIEDHICFLHGIEACIHVVLTDCFHLLCYSTSHHSIGSINAYRVSFKLTFIIKK